MFDTHQRTVLVWWYQITAITVWQQALATPEILWVTGEVTLKET